MKIVITDKLHGDALFKMAGLLDKLGIIHVREIRDARPLTFEQMGRYIHESVQQLKGNGSWYAEL